MMRKRKLINETMEITQKRKFQENLNEFQNEEQEENFEIPEESSSSSNMNMNELKL